ncbi:MAG: hypothetical protein MUP63_01435 [Candidatus Nanohaloarchaeota archaeon QJJ-7]|nr:hypothetical protein [Candidatus Nanohaloarchaeota archaeon QJJ-7]
MPEEVRLEVPEGFSELLEDSVIERGALRELAKRRVEELREEREEAEEHIEEFEEEYGMDLQEFEDHIEGEEVGKEEIEDYNEWSFWVQMREKNTDLIEKAKSIRG